MMRSSGAIQVPEHIRALQCSAADPLASSFVAANAGAGKTHVLSSRVIRLLLAGVEPQRILCLTYTRAAAAEMKARVFTQLGSWALMEEAALVAAITELGEDLPDGRRLERARQLFARALETPGGLKVETIHAFCERVLGRFPLEAGVAPGFTLIDERESAALFGEVLREVFTDDGIGALVQSIATRINEDDLGDIIRQAVSSRRQLRATLTELSAVDLAARIHQALGLAPGMDGEGVIARVIGRDGGRDGTRQAMAALLAQGGKKLATIADTIEVMLAARRDEDAFNLYAQAFLTVTGEPRKLKLTQAMDAHASTLLPFLNAEQHAIIRARDDLSNLEIASYSLKLSAIAGAVARSFANAKRVRQKLDFNDLVEHVRLLLTTGAQAQWVLYKLDGGLEHILIDEAQDTSPDQWDIILQLAAEFFAGAGREPRVAPVLPRSVFAVGDEKQSIYSFQGADPRGFADNRRILDAAVRGADLLFHDVKLAASFRSSPAILAAVDAVFAQPLACAGLSAIAESISHVAIHTQRPGVVELWETLKPPEDEDADKPWDAPVDRLAQGSSELKLAQRLTSHIAAMCQSGEVLASTGAAISPGDFLVLVQRRNAFVNALIRSLKGAGIPVAGADRLQLMEHITVQDLLALGRVIGQADDDLALAGLLKSPLIGICEDALMRIAHGRGRIALARAIETKAGAGDRDAIKAWVALCEFRALGERLSPFDFYARVLGPGGGRRAFVSRLGDEAHDPVDAFLALAAQYEDLHAPSLQGFIAWFERGGGQIKRDLEAGGSTVRVMTVHGAKGLEAPIVILPDTCRNPVMAQHDPKILDLDGAPIFTPSGIKTEATIAAITSSQQLRREESNRLLYVAMTRAKERLIVCGYEKKTAPVADCWYAKIAVGIRPIAREVKTGDITIWRLVFAGDGCAAASASAAPPALPPLPRWAGEHAGREVGFSLLAPSRAVVAAEAPVTSPAIVGPNRFRRGRIIHKLLEHLPALAPSLRAQAAARFLALPAHGLARDEQTEMADAALRVLDDARLAALFSADGLAEAPIAGRIVVNGKDVAVAGTIDRLCITADRVLIADFKTNRNPPTDARDVALSYLVQMALYRNLCRQNFPGRAIIAALIYSEGPSLLVLDDALLDQAVARAFT